jgi:hypothetical protein
MPQSPLSPCRPKNQTFASLLPTPPIAFPQILFAQNTTTGYFLYSITHFKGCQGQKNGQIFRLTENLTAVGVAAGVAAGVAVGVAAGDRCR